MAYSTGSSQHPGRNKYLKVKAGKLRNKTVGTTSIFNKMGWGGCSGDDSEKEENMCRDEALRTIIIQRVNEGRESQKENK